MLNLLYLSKKLGVSKNMMKQRQRGLILMHNLINEMFFRQLNCLKVRVALINIENK